MAEVQLFVHYLNLKTSRQTHTDKQGSEEVERERKGEREGKK